MKKIAFIGSGVIGTALATAACKRIPPSDVVITDVVREKGAEVASRLGCVFVPTNEEAVESSEFVVFCVKPQFLHGVLDGLRPLFAKMSSSDPHKTIVTVCAGVDVSTYIDALGLKGKNVSVMRILPNTACLIGEGFTLIEENTTYTREEEEEFRSIMSESGGFESLPASQFTAGSVLTSTSPAFIAMFANSLADGGVYNGLLRPQARRLALAGMLGTIRLLQSSDKHFEGMKDDVCSPAGPAMYGVKSLEEGGLRSSVIEAVAVAYRRFADMASLR